METMKLNLALLAFASLAGTACFAYDTGEETTTPLQRRALVDVPGKTGMLVLVNYAPGQASKAHVHPGSVFAYVVEGEVVSQLEIVLELGADDVQGFLLGRPSSTPRTQLAENLAGHNTILNREHSSSFRS